MKKREPDFENVRTVLRRVPDSPVLFEPFMNMALCRQVNGDEPDGENRLSIAKYTVRAFEKMGCDCAAFARLGNSETGAITNAAEGRMYNGTSE